MFNFDIDAFRDVWNTDWAIFIARDFLHLNYLLPSRYRAIVGEMHVDSRIDSNTQRDSTPGADGEARVPPCCRGGKCEGQAWFDQRLLGYRQEESRRRGIGQVCYALLDVRLVGDDVPWRDRSRKRNRGTKVPVQIHHPLLRHDIKQSWKTPMDLRRYLWGLAQIARSGVIEEQIIFQIPQTREPLDLAEPSSTPRLAFTLRPAIRSPVPLQWIHISAHAIPDSMADLDCTTMGSADILHKLNCVCKTDYDLSTDGIASLLSDVQRSARDFGEIYGRVRQCWRGYLGGEGKDLYAQQCKREAQHAEIRSQAIRGFTLTSSSVPPRRVWDLYSNRVLPLAVIPSHNPDLTVLPHPLWPVSHSWLAADKRQSIWTPINGRNWPVPIPTATSLEHVRIELLNMGAEYVWLDVLCLRQQGREEDEAQRREEWRIDVPSIGYVYQGQIPGIHSGVERPCVTYFNGLGLPFDSSPRTVNSDRHWFNRVWTLQETLEFWLPGGLTGELHAGDEVFFAHLEETLEMVSSKHTLGINGDVTDEIMRRSCSSELDRIASLAYYFDCSTLPLYDETMHTERAWQVLLKHAWDRSVISVQYAAVHAPFSLFPSWGEYTTPRLEEDALGNVGPLRLDKEERCSDQPGQYFNDGVILGPCLFSPPSPPATSAKDDDEGPVMSISLVTADAPPLSLSITAMRGVVLQGVSYTLVRWSEDDWRSPISWAVVEVIDEPDAASHRITAVRSAIIMLSYEGNKNLQSLWADEESAEREWRVRYLSGEEAMQRSKYRERYMTAFEQMRESEETFILAS